MRDTRSAEQAQSRFLFTSANTPNWSEWTVANAVKDGFKASGWVYRAINAISHAGSSVPWMVVDKDGEPIVDHNISILLDQPNPEISRQELFEIFIAWLQLCGNAYCKRITTGGRTTELWPLSPDKITPIAGDHWVKGFARKGKSGSIAETFDKDEVIHFKFPDPSNPIMGIGPLQAAAKPVDTDVEQQNFNKTAMQNRGIMDGVFVFKNLAASQWETVREKIKEMFTGSENARTPGIIGADANYIRTGMTPAEMDFIESRKFNRDEILLIFGVPPQLVGVQDSATYNNFATSKRVFWEETVIPLLDRMKESLNLSLRNELKDGERIVYDLSNVAALQDNYAERATAAKTLWEQGVPFSNINKRLELGFADVEGGDLPWGGSSPRNQQQPQTLSEPRQSRMSSNDLDAEWRKVDQKREDWAQNNAVNVRKLFEDQAELVRASIENGEDPEQAVMNHRQAWIDGLRDIQKSVAVDFANE